MRTAKARTAIRHHMKNLRSAESVDLGRRLLDKSLRDLGSSLRKVGKVRMNEVLEELDIDSKESLFEQLGLGERLAPITARILVGADEAQEGTQDIASLVIAGTEGMVVSYAKCCYPLPGDAVMGYLTAGRGVVIHRNQCGNLSNFRKSAREVDRGFLGEEDRSRILLPDPVRDEEPHRGPGRGRRDNCRFRLEHRAGRGHFPP